ncbi:MAG TPA: Rieske (2Fe-2S) protein [Gaiellaceae bacterium]|nr:Rieske (2Fe-2S) protein [Gaiellaceae bacterium]
MAGRPRSSSFRGIAAVTEDDVRQISGGWDPDPARSMSLRSDAYTEAKWAASDLEAIFGRTWQWVCHENLAEPGSYVSTTVAGMPVAVVRDRDGDLRAFYNVCRHRAHQLLSGAGTTRNIVCPYHAGS